MSLPRRNGEGVGFCRVEVERVEKTPGRAECLNLRILIQEMGLGCFAE